MKLNKDGLREAVNSAGSFVKRNYPYMAFIGLCTAVGAVFGIYDGINHVREIIINTPNLVSGIPSHGDIFDCFINNIPIEYEVLMGSGQSSSSDMDMTVRIYKVSSINTKPIINDHILKDSVYSTISGGLASIIHKSYKSRKSKKANSNI